MDKAEIKAREIIIKFQFQNPPLIFDEAKKMALISVEEIIKETKLHDLTIFQHGRTGFWEMVKMAITNL